MDHPDICRTGSQGESNRRLAQPAPGQALKLSQTTQGRLRCPACQSRLLQGQADFLCVNFGCGLRFPIVDQVPILINDLTSLFSREDFVAHRDTTMALSKSRLKHWVDNVLPTLGKNLKARENYRTFAELLLARDPGPIVLIIGGSIPGKGFESLTTKRQIELVETDVSFGPRTQLICDAHDLPFADQSFEGVVIQAVLQYVPDPVRCVREIERVLKPGGLVYAETAFMQQVVHGRYDFTRFTHLGVRRLFRGFAEIESGPMAGPGMALAWAGHYFLLSFASHKRARAPLHALARLTLFWLKYFDYFLLTKPGTYDAASGFFFLGKRVQRILPDRQLIKGYRGAE